MSLTGSLSAAVSGLYASAAKTNAAATNIANANTKDYKAVSIQTSSITTTGGVASGVLVHAQEHGSPDIATELVNLIQAETAYQANVTVVRGVDDLYKQLIDVRG